VTMPPVTAVPKPKPSIAIDGRTTAI